MMTDLRPRGAFAAKPPTTEIRSRMDTRKRGWIRQRFVAEAVQHSGDDCLLWPFSNEADGYGLVRFEGKLVLAHREVCRRVHGEPPFEGAQAAHRCGTRRCVNPRHLDWLSNSQNEEDKLRHRKAPSRNALGHRKFTTDEVLKIAADTSSAATLAKAYGCAESTINQIRSGEIWSSATGVERKKRPPEEVRGWHKRVLDETQVREIRNAVSETNASLARRFGLGANAVRKIRNRETWKHVS